MSGRFFYFALFLGINSLQAMVYDNRFFPLIQKPFVTVKDRPSGIRFDGFFIHGSHAVGPDGNDIGIPELFGNYDQSRVAQALQIAGCGEFLRPVWLASELPWSMSGKLEAEGFAITYVHFFDRIVSFGVNTFVMKLDSSIDFFFRPNGSISHALLAPDDEDELDRIRREMNCAQGLACNHVTMTGFGDTDVYLRFGNRYDYYFKFRSIDAGIRFGLLLPTGRTHNIFQPASVPFGGNGFWGLYTSIDGEFEIKEDWKLGLLVRVSKRFTKTKEIRLPLERCFTGYVTEKNTDGTFSQKERDQISAYEPTQFAVQTGQAMVNPGWTGIASAYFSMENLRDGLGLRGQYTITAHQKNSIKTNCEQAVAIKVLEEQSGWASEYATLTAFYDFGAEKICRGVDPIISLSWDIPTTILIGNRFVKSFKVTLGVELNF